MKRRTALPQVAKPPLITDCGPRSVNERSIVGTAIGLPLAATNLNVGTSLLWTVTATAPGYSGNVITIGLCDGTLRVLQYSEIVPGDTGFFMLPIQLV